MKDIQHYVMHVYYIYIYMSIISKEMIFIYISIYRKDIKHYVIFEGLTRKLNSINTRAMKGLTTENKKWSP